MLIRKAYKYRLKTNPETESLLSQFSGCSRLIWNKSLAINLERLKNKHRILYYNELAFWLTFWKKTDELSFLKDCHSQVLQQSLKNLDKAFRDSFDKKQKNKRLPIFKKKGLRDSFRFPQGFKVENRRVYLPKIGWVSFYKSQEIQGKLKNITVSRRGGHWFVSIQTEIEQEIPKRELCSSVGVDRGVKHFAVLSNGEFLAPLNSFKKHARALKYHQKSLARKVKGSKNCLKQKKRIAKKHIKIADARKDYLHKCSSKISKNHAIIILEDLKTANMTKSARGSLESPGTRVKAKSGLNQAILDQGWFEFSRQLEYKQKFSGGKLVLIDPKYTSQKCPQCGSISKDNRKSQSKFVCKKCKYKNNADLTAALNILAAGQCRCVA